MGSNSFRTVSVDASRRFDLHNAAGMRVSFLELGGIITGIEVPDRHGKFSNVALSYHTLAEYLADTAYLGAIVGRYANRIAQARFILDGREYRLEPNDGKNHLHGGPGGFHRARWTVNVGSNASTAILDYTSSDGEEGYPGELVVRTTYTVSDANELRIEYHATTTQATPVNLSQHSYFNLAGAGNGDILDHDLTISAARFVPVDRTLIPTGELRPVRETPFDFNEPARIGSRIHSEDEQLRFGKGYDHSYVLDRSSESGLELAATLRDRGSGRVMEVFTTEPGLQLYTGNVLSSALPVAMGTPYGRHAGLALETQHFPDSPNRPRFPSTILRPGEEYRSLTVYAFGTDASA